MPKPIRGSEVFWEAALELDKPQWKGSYCCPTMAKLMFDSFIDYMNKEFLESDEYQLFKERFKPDTVLNDNDSWFDIYEPDTVLNDNDYDFRQVRILIMLFMEQIWKDEHGN